MSRERLRTAAAIVGIAMIATACGGSTTSSSSDSATATTATGTSAGTPPDRPADDATNDAPVLAAAQTFIDSRTSENAKKLVSAIAEDGDLRWTPWLLDVLRLGLSNLLDQQIGEVLEASSGIPAGLRIPNLIAYGSWSHALALDGGTGYREFKSTVYERIDPQFGPLLASVESQTELAAIQWGGVPLGGIPELNNPQRVSVAEADHMFDDEVVLGIVAGGEAVAYPLRIMARHELANDTIGGDDLAIVYCTLCRSALVFERTVDGRTLNFLTSGLLLNSNKIMYDRETGTLWHHLRGLGIGGPLTGTELQVRAVDHMSWSDWVAEYPDSEVLTLPEPIFFDNPERPPLSYDYTPGEAYRSYYEDPEVWFPIGNTPDTFAIKTEVVGIRHNGDAVAFDVAVFNELGVDAEIEVGGALFRVESTGAGVRVFDERGERVITEQSFWFAWFANNPETRSWHP